jgi:two-component system, NarL family, response regulator LiaR
VLFARHRVDVRRLVTRPGSNGAGASLLRGSEARESPARPIRVLIAYRDDLARNAIRDALIEAGLAVVGQAADAPMAVSLVTRCLPDVVLLDAALPPEGGVAALDVLRATAPEARTILLAPSDHDQAGLVALSRGAQGYLSGDIELGSLAHAIEGVMAGEAAISREMAGRLVERLRELSGRRQGTRPVRSPLTTREWEVLDLLKGGKSTAEIAKDLVLSPDTVYTHVRHILRKLRANSRAEAVEIADQLPALPKTPA